MPAIRLKNVTKMYGRVTAVENLIITVKQGEIYGFLGPNSAGKSTTTNMLLDFTWPTNGEVQVLGHDAQRQSLPICDRAGVLREGKLVAENSIGELQQAMGSEETLIVTLDSFLNDATEVVNKLAFRL